MPAEPPPPQRDDLRRFLLGQSPGTIYLLAAVMYHGRGDFDPEFLLDEYVDLSDTFPKPEAMVDQMMAKRIAVRVVVDRVRSWDHRKLGLPEIPVGGSTARYL